MNNLTGGALQVIIAIYCTLLGCMEAHLSEYHK